MEEQNLPMPKTQQPKTDSVNITLRIICSRYANQNNSLRKILLDVDIFYLFSFFKAFFYSMLHPGERKLQEKQALCLKRIKLKIVRT